MASSTSPSLTQHSLLVLFVHELLGVEVPDLYPLRTVSFACIRLGKEAYLDNRKPLN